MKVCAECHAHVRWSGLPHQPTLTLVPRTQSRYSRVRHDDWVSNPLKSPRLPRVICLGSSFPKELMQRNPPVASPRPPRPPHGDNGAPRSRKSPKVQMKPLTSRDFFFEGPGLEPPARYRPGGYHPVHIGDIYRERYRVIHKLGHGTYSTVWLAHDLSSTEQTYVGVVISCCYDHPLSQGAPAANSPFHMQPIRLPKVRGGRTCRPEQRDPDPPSPCVQIRSETPRI